MFVKDVIDLLSKNEYFYVLKNAQVKLGSNDRDFHFIKSKNVIEN